MKKWLKLFEDQEILGDDDYDPSEDEDNKRYAAEEALAKKVRQYCEQEIGWSFDDRSRAITFDLEYNELIIIPDDSDIKLEQLEKLKPLGEVSISGASQAYVSTITIKTPPGLSLS